MKSGHCITRLAVLLGLTFLATGALAQSSITLKVHHFMGPQHTAQQKLIQPWCDRIAKESNERLKCQIYPALQLGGTPAQLFDQVKDGVVDIVWTVPTYQAGRFIKTEVFDLPFMTKTAKGSSQALWEYIQQNALDEYKGTRLILTHVHDGVQMHFARKRVATLEELKGMKIRAPGRIGAHILAAVGANPVQMPMPQVPEALAKGVVDGALLPWEVIPTIKLQEVSKYHLETGPGRHKISNTFLILAMNEARYDSLPADLKKVIDDNSGLQASAWAGEVWDGTIPAGRQSVLDRKDEIYQFTDAEYARWQKATEKVTAEWIKGLEAKGVDGQKLFDSARALIERYDP